MILHRLEFRGISTAFPETVVIDFDELGPGLVAFVGENGHGKTHAMELSGPATLFRKFPSYGNAPFASHIHPDADLATSELEFSVGKHRYSLLVKFDPSYGGGKGKTRATLRRDGEIIAGPERLGDVDAELDKILSSYQVMLASSFACQSREGSFDDLKKGDRKALFMEMLGLGRLERVGVAARGKRQGNERLLEVLRPQVAALVVKATRCTEIDTAVAQTTTRLGDLAKQLEDVRAAQSLATETHATAREALTRLEARAETYATQNSQLTAALEGARTEERTALVAHETNRKNLDGADGIESAHKRCQEIDGQLAEANRVIEDAREKLRPVDAELASLGEQRSSLLAEYRRLDGELPAAEEAEKSLDGAEDLARMVELRRNALLETKGDVVAGESRTEGIEAGVETERNAAARRKQLVERRAEIVKRTGILESIDAEHPMCRECPLTADAIAASDSLKDIEHEIEELTVGGTPAADALGTHRDEIRRLRGLEGVAAESLTAAERSHTAVAATREKASKAPQLREDLGKNKAEGQSVRGKIDALESAKAQIQTSIDHHVRTRTDLENEKRPLAPLAERIQEVSAARAQHDQLEEAHGAATLRRLAAEENLAALGTAPDLEATRATVGRAEADVIAANRSIEQLGGEIEPLSKQLHGLRGERTALGEPQAELDKIETDTRRHETDAADWAQLEKAFGRDGIQALEIDAAGPSVTALANDLLASCYGSRFQLRIDTTQETVKGDKVKEIFEVKILDAEAPGSDRESGSGGEQAILDEALRLAIAIFNTQRSGREMLTLWRDETGGALSPVNASRYVQMLRRARELGGFHQVLFISHSEAVWSQADRQLFFVDGKVSESRPQQVAA